MPPARFPSPVLVTCNLNQHYRCGSIVVASNGRIYCAPMDSEVLLEMDPTTFCVTELDLYPTLLPGTDRSGGIAEGPDGKLYISPDGYDREDFREDVRPDRVMNWDWKPFHSHVHVFDLSAQEAPSIFGPRIDSYNFWAITQTPNGKLYCFPGRAHFGGDVLVIDARISSMSVLEGGCLANGVAVASTGWMCCAPVSGNCVLAIDSNSDSFHYIYDDEVLESCGLLDKWSYLDRHDEFPENTQSFSGIAVAPNGKFYCCPQDSQRILVVDLAAWKVQAFGNVGDGKNKWSGITLASDGRLYCAPWFSPTILMIDPAFDSHVLIDVDCSGLNSWGAIVSCGDRLWCAPCRAEGFLTMLLPRPDLGALRSRGRSFDLVIKSDEDFQIECHRCVVMTASCVFERMLAETTFLEGRARVIAVQGASTQSMEQLVHYFYFGSLLADGDIAELAGLARAYGLDLLLGLCLEQLFDRMTPDNIVESVRIFKLHQDATPEAAFWWHKCKELVMRNERYCLPILDAV
mmetsp:Transcript_53843/g.166844  ORF Transcript_53843/g.166844 Transcript_53843/m.166844 type:complete len:518 (-) Transcript_53843:59-1612(-)|eukprot:CAMPEP_0204588486 /NCGR_PEP_ID=MMETSP0661-20131031/48649_1 /ASSEMBLY_ACC=CAM_ASM_000606 /TAXON_ID=109239 /ORGANISM="Alexandrium margalefi, Strain AMGDE01CS-322" /LENGTH=517 /DNA_ID=CAMNT_0051598303 /DNA_START=58 /DNA_END=1611 /DNA_ORIENTATION=+